MFDVERAIADWRQAHCETGSASSDTIEELECHLRDMIAALEKSGLAADEAFLVAANRLGSAHEIAAEFAKIDSRALWSNRLKWMLAGYLVTNLGSLAFDFSTKIIELIATNAGVSTWSAIVTASYAPLCFILLTTWACLGTRLGRRSLRFLSDLPRSLSTPLLAIVSCSIILAAHVLFFICRRAVFLTSAKNYRLWETIAHRDALIILVAPMVAAVLFIWLARPRTQAEPARELAS